MKKNWETTLFGSIATIAGGGATQFPDGAIKNILVAVAGISGVLFAYFTASINGTKQPTP